MKTHLVSQLLLRQFSKNGKVKVNSKFSTEAYLLKPNNFAFINVPDELFAKSEYKFHQIETRAATSLSKIENENILKNEVHKSNIKKFMVLHYVRSAAFMSLFLEREQKYFDKFIDGVKKSHPDSTNEIENNKHALRSNWHSYMIKKIPLSLIDNIEKVDNYIQGFEIEIGVAPPGLSFLLGDIPAINIDNKGNLGILNGVGITNSVGFALPLSPKYIVASIKSNKNNGYRALTLREVGNCNVKSLKACIAEYFTQP